jgi:hypothetical protein
MVADNVVVMQVFQNIAAQKEMLIACQKAQLRGISVHFGNYLFPVPLVHAVEIQFLAREYLSNR